MNTPKKNQSVTTPVSQFEDSPVFTYLNNLSPIKSVKSIHIAQTYSSVNFGSPSVFTSPHVNSLKESRFFTRGNSSDSPTTDFLSKEEDKTDTKEVVVEPVVNFTSDAFPVKFGCQSSACDQTEAKNEASCEELLQKMGCKESKSETNWENLIFSSPNDADAEAFRGIVQKPIEPVSQICGTRNGCMSQNISVATTSRQCMDVNPSEYEPISGATTSRQCMDVNPSEYVPISGATTSRQCMDVNPSEYVPISGATTSHQCMDVNPSKYVPSKSESDLHHGIRRRCLNFSALTAWRNGEGSNPVPLSMEARPSAFMKLGGNDNKSRCLLPGIGLHLNPLAQKSKDSSNFNPETLHSGRLQLSVLSPTALQSLGTCQESLSYVSSSRKEPELNEDVSDELNQISPKKKKQKSENGAESGKCKRCNCKKSKCLKLYCECFAAGVYCIGPCSCVDCFNKPIHEDIVLATRKQILSRNPLAFAPKVIRNSDAVVVEAADEPSKTPASARHKRGCNCKKSNCLKKYCECFQSGVGCSSHCRCECCKNVFGRKEVEAGGKPGASYIEELEENKDISLQKSETSNEEERYPISTPLQHYRSAQPLFAAKSSLGGFNGKLYDMPNFPSNFQNVNEGDKMIMPPARPGGGIKTTSPNSKRVSLFPNAEPGSPRISGRKLMLPFPQ